MLGFLGMFVPNLLRSAGAAAVKSGFTELTKNIGMSAKPADNKKAAIAAFVSAVITLLNNQYDIKVPYEWNMVVIAGFWLVTILFSVSKPREKPEVEK